MTAEMFKAALEAADAKLDKSGRAELPEGRKITLYLAHDGASLSVSRVVEVTLKGEVVTAADDKGEQFLVGLGDIFAASVSAEEGATNKRKAGFLR